LPDGDQSHCADSPRQLKLPDDTTISVSSKIGERIYQG